MGLPLTLTVDLTTGQQYRAACHTLFFHSTKATCNDINFSAVGERSPMMT